MVTTQRVSEEKRTELLHERVQEKLSTLVGAIGTSCGDLEVSLTATRESFERFRDLFRIARLDADLSFEMLVSCTATDHLDSRPVRFDVVYHLLSLKHLHRLRVVVAVDERLSEVPSLTPLWKSANWMEREVFDMYGIRFEGHPDLRRILMYDGFDGYPLRKDFPVQGKQPRVPMLSPEVRNTAMDLTRAPLVGINPRKKGSNGKSGEESQRGAL